MLRHPYSAMLTTIVVLFLDGCETPSTPAPPAVTGAYIEGIGLRNHHASNPVPGIDYAALAGVRQNRKLMMVIWTDLKRDDQDAVTSVGRDGLSFRVAFREKPISCIGKIRGVNDGSMTIGTLKYDLSAGALFLVSSRGDTPIVKQIDRDMSQLDIPPNTLLPMAQKDPEITGFFKEMADARNDP